MWDFVLAGLSNFVVHRLSLELVNVEVPFNLTFPIELKSNSSNFRVILGDLVPFYGEGILT
jgi:hypothetical protein